MSGLAGCDLWPTSTMASQFSVSPTSWLIARNGIRWSTCSTDRPSRTLDFTTSVTELRCGLKRIPGKRAAYAGFEVAGRQIGWAKKKSARPGFGSLLNRSFLTYVPTVVEVEVSDDGEIRIPVSIPQWTRVW